MQIGIVGLGLIGGSLGFDLIQSGHHIYGLSRRQKTCNHAIRRGAVSQASTDPKILNRAELVFLCTPIGSLAQSLALIIPHLMTHTVVTDVGSVKAPVVETLQSLWPNFVGGHPMAGTAETGILAAQNTLFKDRPYVLTPNAATNLRAIELVKDVVIQLKAQLYFASPSDHDRAVAWISHLPILVSAGLMSSCIQESDQAVLSLAKSLASTGFRDTSRVGSGNPELGRMVAEHNQVALLKTLDQFETSLKHIRALIEHHEWNALEKLLQENQTARPMFVD